MTESPLLGRFPQGLASKTLLCGGRTDPALGASGVSARRSPRHPGFSTSASVSRGAVLGKGPPGSPCKHPGMAGEGLDEGVSQGVRPPSSMGVRPLSSTAPESALTLARFHHPYPIHQDLGPR